MSCRRFPTAGSHDPRFQRTMNEADGGPKGRAMRLRLLTIVALLVGLGLVAGAQEPGKAAAAAKGSWTGFITDTHCGKKGANEDHTADCVTKCMKGGSKAQIWSETDQKALDLDSFDKVKSMVGQRVTVKGTLDPASNTIKVESAEKATPAK